MLWVRKWRTVSTHVIGIIWAKLFDLIRSYTTHNLKNIWENLNWNILCCDLTCHCCWGSMFVLFMYIENVTSLCSLLVWALRYSLDINTPTQRGKKWDVMNCSYLTRLYSHKNWSTPKNFICNTGSIKTTLFNVGACLIDLNGSRITLLLCLWFAAIRFCSLYSKLPCFKSIAYFIGTPRGHHAPGNNVYLVSISLITRVCVYIYTTIFGALYQCTPLNANSYPKFKILPNSNVCYVY